ncbi:MAG TPA: hypothetical protein VLH19_02020 [Patescibacteria group bacterium]|nr:hypothetical protein [Patescibacteria group bacterium]
MNIKKMAVGAISVVAAFGMMTGLVNAIDDVTVSDQASNNACFGQARASYAQFGPNGVLAPFTNGYYISQRKGDNPENNAWYIANFCQTD